MRWSAQQRNEPAKLSAAARKRGLTSDLGRPPNALRIGLVGARDVASVAVRRAQSILRLDGRPSYFSHAFLFTGLGDEILECRLVEADPRHPEFNAVCRSKASRYEDPKEFPNLALLTLVFPRKDERPKAILDRAGNPDAARERYDLVALVAGWQPYLFRPERETNPLTREIPHPATAYLRWALEAGFLDSSPGSIEPNDSPEHLWALATHFSEAYKGDEVRVAVRASARIDDPFCTVEAASGKIPFSA